MLNIGSLLCVWEKCCWVWNCKIAGKILFKTLLWVLRKPCCRMNSLEYQLKTVANRTHTEINKGGEREREGERKHTETDTHRPLQMTPKGNFFLLQCKYFIGMWPSLQKAIWWSLDMQILHYLMGKCEETITLQDLFGWCWKMNFAKPAYVL